MFCLCCSAFPGNALLCCPLSCSALSRMALHSGPSVMNAVIFDLVSCVLCCAVQCSAVLCCAVLRCAALCCAVLCCAMLRSAQQEVIPTPAHMQKLTACKAYLLCQSTFIPMTMHICKSRRSDLRYQNVASAAEEEEAFYIEEEEGFYINVLASCLNDVFSWPSNMTRT